MYGIERAPRSERRPSAPRAITRDLAKLGATRTPRASELREVGPETNDPKGGTVAVVSTEVYPGGPAVVEVSRAIAEATDTDAHLEVNADGDAELVEPVGAVQPEGDGSLEGEDNTGDPRTEGSGPADRNDDPGAPGSPSGGESMTSERVGVARQSAPSVDGTTPAKQAPAKQAPRKGTAGK